MIRHLLFLLFLVFISLNLIAKEKLVLEANTVKSLNDNITIAEGDVVIFYSGMTISGDRAVYDKALNIVEVSGHITYSDEKNNLFYADYIKIYLDSKNGEIKNVRGFYAPYHYFNADEIKKVGENNFLLIDGQISTCKGETPDWSFKTKRARIDYGEYLYSRSATANIRNVPVFYIPYFVWPIKIKRESGFLVPDIGMSSKKGYFYSQKYFWDIDVDKDATLGLTYFTKDGLLYNGEFRYKRSEMENFYLYGETLKNRNYDYIEKDYRWRIYNQGNFFLTENFEIKTYIDYVSDFEYLTDYEKFSLNEYIKENKDNKFKIDLRLIYRHKFADISMIYKDDMKFTDTDTGYTKEHLYRKPQLIVEKSEIDLHFFKFRYFTDFNKVENDYKIFNLEDGSLNKSLKKFDRLHAKLSIYKPINLKIGTFTPQFTEYYTKWFNLNFDYTKMKDIENDFLKLRTGSNYIERYIYSYTLKFELNEIYKNYKTFKHSIYNTLTYTQTPYLDQSIVPDYLENDKIGEVNLYTYKMTHFLNSKKWKLKAEFIQSYDVTKDEERFTPFTYLMDYNYNSFLKIYKKGNYDYYEKEPTYNKDSVELSYKIIYLRSEFVFDRDITDDKNSSWSNTIGVKYKKYNVSFTLKKSGYLDKLRYSKIDSFKTDEMSLKGVYNADCWSMGLQYVKKLYTDFDNGISDKYEHTVYFLISLKGIGGTGREIYSALK